MPTAMRFRQETLSTMVAHIRPSVGVHVHMTFIVGAVHELLVALFTLIVVLASVPPHVHTITCDCCEMFSTRNTEKVTLKQSR